MNRRMLTALVALVGVFVALYLALYKAGVIGTLACGGGGCETVQLSKWATFLGMPVANWGVLYYVGVFVVAFTMITDFGSGVRALPGLLLAMTTWGVVFTAWLTYLELFVIHAICRYCVASAGVVVALWVLSFLEFRAFQRSEADAPPPSGL